LRPPQGTKLCLVAAGEDYFGMAYFGVTIGEFVEVRRLASWPGGTLADRWLTDCVLSFV